MRKFVERRLSGCRGLLLLLLLWATAACRDAERPPAQIVFPTPTPTPLGYFAGTPQPGGVWTRLLSANPLNFNPFWPQTVPAQLCMPCSTRCWCVGTQ